MQLDTIPRHVRDRSYKEVRHKGESYWYPSSIEQVLRFSSNFSINEAYRFECAGEKCSHKPSGGDCSPQDCHLRLVETINDKGLLKRLTAAVKQQLVA